MSEQHIKLRMGDTLIITGVPEGEPDVPPTGGEDFTVLIEIGGVPIYTNPGGTYVHFLSDLDVCTDGTGGHHGDMTPLNKTAYYNNGKYLNADKDKYVVVPPQVRSMVPPIVMGCAARVTNMKTGVVKDGVVGEIGPDYKTGECAICLAQELNSQVTANCGDSDKVYFYELWPGKPAVVDGKTYKLEPA